MVDLVLAISRLELGVWVGVTFCRIAVWDRFGDAKAFILDITNLRGRLGKN